MPSKWWDILFPSPSPQSPSPGHLAVLPILGTESSSGILGHSQLRVRVRAPVASEEKKWVNQNTL